VILPTNSENFSLVSACADAIMKDGTVVLRNGTKPMTWQLGTCQVVDKGSNSFELRGPGLTMIFSRPGDCANFVHGTRDDLLKLFEYAL
jgi:hypothetical protein